VNTDNYTVFAQGPVAQQPASTPPLESGPSTTNSPSPSTSSAPPTS
jgi:hypothetical protein